MNIAIIGYGKMGKEIEKILLTKQHQILLKINSSNTFKLTAENLKNIDVAIEFSGPESAFANIKLCLENKVPVICGSTGWLDKLEQIEKCVLQNDTAFLYASNFSLGVNVLFAINEKLAQLLSSHKDYQIDLEEIHHLEKKDAPSGTAISLATQIIKQSDHRFTKWSLIPEENALPIKAVRAPDVPGTHHIKYDSDQDIIEVKHTAKNRKGFALGAVLAAEFIFSKKGIFTMKDVLNV